MTNRTDDFKELKANEYKFTRSSLQLSQFIDKYFDVDDSQIEITYNDDVQVFFVQLTCRSELKVYNLVTQKNTLRSFSSMATLFNTLPLESGVTVQLDFESASK